MSDTPQAPARSTRIIRAVFDYVQDRKAVLLTALAAVAANVSFVEVESDKGHDAFLLDEPDMFETLRGFLSGAAARRGFGGP